MGKVILIVEDDPKSLTLTKDLLKISGYDTIQATDGQQGVEVAKAKRPDLILMDIMMPKMDGYTATNILKKDEVTKKIPIVMLTAVGYELNKQLADKVGSNGYITKPFSRQQLIDAINPLLGVH